MKLSITHLAPYLPYGLKGIAYVSKDIALDYVDIVGCNRSELYCEYTSERYKNMSGARKLFDLYKVKPLLIPMSSLYTEMKNGKVPIVEIYKKMFVFPRIKEYKIEDGCLKFDKHTFEWVDEFRAFSLDGDTAYITIEVSDYLDENHFDWRYGLIDKGLALDKTKIK